MINETSIRKIVLTALLVAFKCGHIFGESSTNCRPSSSPDKTGPGNGGLTPWLSLLQHADYSAQSPPTSSQAGSDFVYVAIQILDIDEVNENQMYYQIQMFVITSWVDERLTTDSLNQQRNKRILLPDDAFHCFWTPSLIFDNNKDGKMFSLSVPNTMMVIYANKTVFQASRFSIKVRCRFDLSRYPMDVQRCQFRMRLFDEPDELVTLRWISHPSSNFTWITSEAIRVNANIKPIKFKLNISAEWTQSKIWLNSKYTYLGVNITFTRLLTSSLLTIYIPSTLTVTLSWVSFWIDVQGIPGRVSLGIMSILTIITQILDIRKNMPPVSYVTAIDIWLFVCLMSVFLSLIEYAFAYNYIKKHMKEQQGIRTTNHPHNVEQGEIKSLTTSINGITRVAWTPLNVKPDQVHRGNNRFIKAVLSALHLRHLKTSDFSISKLDDNSKIFFPLLFTIFAFVYWIYYALSERGFGGGEDEL